MNKQDLVHAIALEIPSLSRKEIANFLSTLTTVLERGFQEQGTVRIDGFGTIKKLADGSPAFRFFPSFARGGEVLEGESEPEPVTDSLPEAEPENKTVVPMRKRTPAKK